MPKKRIVVNGGGNNLYRISGSGSSYYVSQIIVNTFIDDVISVGTAGSFDDALSLIKSHSGHSIKNITNW